MNHNYEQQQHTTREDFLYNLRNRIDDLTLEQKGNIKSIIEFHKTKNITFNRNGMFLVLNELNEFCTRDILSILSIYEKANKFMNNFKPDPIYQMNGY